MTGGTKNGGGVKSDRLGVSNQSNKLCWEKTVGLESKGEGTSKCDGETDKVVVSQQTNC